MTGEFCRSSIAENLRVIHENILAAKLKAGRGSDDFVQVMAVTKTIDAARVNEAVACGVLLLGENRVQEFLSKACDYSPECSVHFIGGLQTNKIRQVVGKVDMIQSVDSVKSACEIARQSEIAGNRTDILLQVNIGGEQSKGGVPPEEVQELAARVASEFAEWVTVRGLMTIPPIGDSERAFERMRRLYEDMRAGSDTVDTLSMGMSGDYESAVRHGATIVRVGTALFGRRD
ncbi:MAG: YggS family pyridoxal phosphate-dependent enzyme [Oscillospiraceae bacterium]|nr:YggS family pyridoxal phosphate-dependent enzyme [Oscillospiraceae bacterium]